MERRVRRRVLPSVLTRGSSTPMREPLRELNGEAAASGATRFLALGDWRALHGGAAAPGWRQSGADPPVAATGGGGNAVDFGGNDSDEEVLLCPEVLEEMRTISRRYALQRGCAATAGGTNCCAICHAATAGRDCLRVSACGHEFHAACLSRWVIDYRATCPLCRATVG